MSLGGGEGRGGEGRGGGFEQNNWLLCQLATVREVSSVGPLSERKDDGRSKSQLKKKLFTVVNFHYQLSL